MDLVQNAPYVLGVAGITMIAVAVMTRANGLLNGFVLRFVPALVGGLCLWTSALMLAGA